MSEEPDTLRRNVETSNMWQILSSRLSKVEISQIKLGDKVKDLAEQILQFQISTNRSTYDIANAAIENLDQMLLELDKKIDDTAERRAHTTDPNELFMLEMMSDTFAERKRRALSERKQAVLRRDNSNSLINDTNQRLAGMKKNDQTLSFPPIHTTESKPHWADKFLKWFSNLVAPAFVIALIYIILQALWEYIKGKLNGTIP